MTAYRLGITAAQANVGLQRANRFSDAYVLFQPYTYQNNAPYGKQSGTSWAVGITVPLPVYNRNQGNIERAKINVYQIRGTVGLSEETRRDRGAQAIKEYEVSGQIAEQIREQDLARIWNSVSQIAAGSSRKARSPSLCFSTPSAIQRDGQGLSGRGGASSPQHAELEHGRRPANLAVNGHADEADHAARG